MKTKKKPKKDKSSSESSESDIESSSDVEHDLTDYAGNSIKLMTEIFKILGSKKLKQMVPAVLKPIDIDDLKACLVEESMALSKKRLVAILNGETYSSNSDSEEEDEIVAEKKTTTTSGDLDVISLDGISDDSDIFCFDDLPEAEMLTDIKKEGDLKREKHKKHKKLKKQKDIVKNKVTEDKKLPEKSLSKADEKAMTALELLELQARARAIKSQLALESVTSPIDNVDEEIKEETIAEKAKSESSDQPSNSTQIKSTTRKIKLRRDHLRMHPNRKTVNSKQKEVETKKSTPPPLAEEENKDLPPPVEVIKRERHSSTESLIVESPAHPLIVITSSDDEKSPEKEGSTVSKEVNLEASTSLVEENCAEVNENEPRNTGSEKDQSSEENEKETPEEAKGDSSQDQKNDDTNNSNIEENCQNEITSNTDNGNKEPEVSTIQSKSNEETVCKDTNQDEQDPQSEKIPNKESEDLDFIIIDSEPEFDSEPEEVERKSKTNENSLKDAAEYKQDECDDDDMWKKRWLGSKKVTSVLRTSKLCNSVKRKITLKKDLAANSGNKSEK